MLTKEEIKNLRIGDEIWVDGKIEEVTLLGPDYLWTNETYHHLHTKLMDENYKASLNPPKKMKKYWLWAISDGAYEPLRITTAYYDEEYQQSNEDYGVNLMDTYFKQKLDYTMIEVEVKWW